MNSAQSISRHLTGRALMSKLDQILGARPRQKPEYYTLERLCELIEPRDRDELIVALGHLVRSGKIKSLIRVVSPFTQGGVADFRSLEEIPPVITDWRSGLVMEVKPENLRIIYVVPAANDA
jgi:hypothetical protein